MIRNFADKETARLARNERSRKLPPEIQDKAFRLLRRMAEAENWNDLRSPPGNKFHALHGDREGQYAIWIDSQWRIAFRPASEDLIDVEITDYMDDEPISRDPADWLHNPHAGEMLHSEFLEPLGFCDADIAGLIGVEEVRIADVVAGRKPIDAELDVRLGRYFGMSAGFFLRFQVAYELLEARRALNGELDRIVPRAA